MRILVCGDRDWRSDRELNILYGVLDDLLIELNVSCVIHGDACGVDRAAGEWARERGPEVKKFPAKWKEQGKAAGPIRNQQMLDEGKPDMVVAFHNNIGESKGTLDMIKRANKAGLDVRLHSSTLYGD